MADEDIAPEWRVVQGFEDYEISDTGVIRRCTDHPRLRHWMRAGAMIKQTPLRVRTPRKRSSGVGECSYWMVSLWKPPAAKPSKLLVHRLVALAFIGPPPTPEHQIAHGPLGSLNNSVGNLRWATRSENQLDRRRDGTDNRGSKHPLSRLTEADVRQILAALAAGARVGVIAKQFQVSATVISGIKSGKHWMHVTPPVPPLAGP